MTDDTYTLVVTVDDPDSLYEDDGKTLNRLVIDRPLWQRDDGN
jgi:hypothetical protein